MERLDRARSDTVWLSVTAGLGVPDGGVTPVSFTDSSTAAGYALDATPVEVTIQSGSLDMDDNGEADALSDGIVMLRYLFGFTGGPLVAGALAPDAQRTDPEEITIVDLTGVGALDAAVANLVTERALANGVGTPFKP